METERDSEFYLNNLTREIHHLPSATIQCQVQEIKKGTLYLSLEVARKVLGASLCAYCFKSKN